MGFASNQPNDSVRFREARMDLDQLIATRFSSVAGRAPDKSTVKRVSMHAFKGRKDRHVVWSDRSQHSRRSPDRNARERLNAVYACPVFTIVQALLEQ